MRFRCFFVVWLVLVGTQAPANPWREWSVSLLDQAVLAHRMTKSACLVMLGADPEVHVNDIGLSADRFATQEDALKDLAAREDVLGSLAVPLEQAHGIANPLSPSAQQIAAGDLHAVVVTLLLQRNELATDKFVELSGQVPASALQAQTELAIRTAGQLRVRSQEILRDLCLLRAGLGSRDLRQDMATSMQEFDALAEALIVGDAAAGLPKAPNVQIKLKMKAVQKKWATLSGFVRDALEAEIIETGDILLSSVMGDSVLKALDQVLAEYQKL